MTTVKDNRKEGLLSFHIFVNNLFYVAFSNMMERCDDRKPEERARMGMAWKKGP